MTGRTVAKLALAGAGLLLFLVGARFELAWLRWVAIALVAAAFALRFGARAGRAQ